MSTTIELTGNEPRQSFHVGVDPAQRVLDGMAFELTGTSEADQREAEQAGAGDLMRELMRYEEPMLQWLSASEANAQAFMSDPMGTFQRVMDAPDELLDALRKLRQGAELDGDSGGLDGLSALADAASAAIAEATPPDLSAGWDLLSAVTQAAVNHRLSALYTQDVLPSALVRPFTVGSGASKLSCTPDLALGCPQFGTPYAGTPTLVLPISGTIDVTKVRVSVATVTVGGQAALSTAIDQLGATVTSDGSTITVTIPSPGDALFTDLDLTDLTIDIKPKGGKDHDLDPETYAPILLAAMNEAVASLDWPMSWTFDSRVPLPPEGLQGHLDFTDLGGDTDDNLFALLMSRETRTGSTTLSAQTVPDGCSASFIVSNDALLQGMATLLARTMHVPETDFAVSDAYPATMKLTTDVSGAYGNVKYKIKSGDLYAYVNDDGQLYLKCKGKVKDGWKTLWTYQSVTVQAWFSFSAVDGKLQIKGSWKGSIPWWWWLVLPPFIKIISMFFGSGDGSVEVPIPGFDILDVESPAYLQIGGRWAEQPFHIHQQPLSPVPIVQTMSVHQALSDGKFVFDFSAYGSVIKDYTVGVAYWYYQFSTSTDHQTQTVALSLADVRVHGAKVTVTPAATLDGQGHGIDKDASSLTLCCVAVLDQADDGMTLTNTWEDIADGEDSGPIAVEDTESGNPMATLTGWNLEYFNNQGDPSSHHVRTIQLEAAPTDIQPSSVQIASTAIMHDDSNNNASASITGGVLKLGDGESSLLVAQVTAHHQRTDETLPVDFDGVELSAAAVFLQSYRVHYSGSDHDIRIVGGGTPSWEVSGSTVTLTNPCAVIGDGNSGTKHTQDNDNGDSYVSFVVVGVVKSS